MSLNRRGFIKLTGAGLAAFGLGALGFAHSGEALAASVRPFKLPAATETRNTCTYCSVACGILIYSMGDRAKNARSDIIHVEGDPDHPVNRGTLCPKGSALLDVVHAPTRLKSPRYWAPGKLAASASTNETAYLSWKVSRALGMVVFEAGEFYRALDKPAQVDLIKNPAADLVQVKRAEIKRATISHFYQADQDYGTRLAAAVDVDLKDVHAMIGH